MKKVSHFAIGLISFLLVLVFVTGFNKCTNRNGPEMDKVSLRLQWIHQAQFVGFYVAKEKGFYAERNIDLTIRPGGMGYNVPIMVAQEQEDFGLWVADQVLISRAKQQMPIQAIGTVFNRSLACFMVRTDGGIETPKDFEGKTIGVYPGFDTETIYKTLLKKYGVERSKVNEVTANYDLNPFFDGQVQIWPSYVINEPLVAGKRGVPVKCLTPKQFGLDYYSDTLIVNERTLREKRDLVERFLEASEKGWRFALKNPEEAVEIVLKYQTGPLDREHETRMFNALAEYVNPTDPMFQMTPEVWQSMAQVLFEQKLIDSPDSFRQLCDFDIAKDAHRKMDK